MPEALCSFLISVSIIIAIALFVPCIESLARLLRRNTSKTSTTAQTEPTKTYSRKVA